MTLYSEISEMCNSFGAIRIALQSIKELELISEKRKRKKFGRIKERTKMSMQVLDYLVWRPFLGYAIQPVIRGLCLSWSRKVLKRMKVNAVYYSSRSEKHII